MMSEVGVWVLQNWSLMHHSNFVSYLPLETEVGGFLIPTNGGGRDGVHGLDMLHKSYWDPGQEVGNQGGGILGFIEFGLDDI